MLQEIEDLRKDTTSNSIKGEQAAMSLEDCKCQIMLLQERLQSEKRDSMKLREDSTAMAKIAAAKMKDINLKVFNAIAERNHWKKKVGMYVCL
jgi:hypothetical protein